MMTSTLKPEFLDQFRGMDQAEQLGPITAAFRELAMLNPAPTAVLFDQEISDTPIIEIPEPFVLLPNLKCNGDSLLISSDTVVAEDEEFGKKLFSGMRLTLLRLNQTIVENYFKGIQETKLRGVEGLRKELSRLRNTGGLSFQRYVSGEKFKAEFDHALGAAFAPTLVHFHNGAADTQHRVYTALPPCGKVVYSSPFSVLIRADENGVLHYFFYVKITGYVVTEAEAQAKLAMYHVEGDS
jgi:hypothetical protein